jgi:hypothetical protein
MRIYLLITLLASFSATAGDEEWGNINAWDTNGFSQAHVTYPDKSTKTFQAGIGGSPNGKQIVEFRFFDSSHDICNSQPLNKFSDVILKISGKRVKMKAGCKRVAILRFLHYQAATEAGNSHIVNSFKNNDSVSINIQGYDVEIPAQGFEAAWESYGGDAI